MEDVQFDETEGDDFTIRRNHPKTEAVYRFLGVSMNWNHYRMMVALIIIFCILLVIFIRLFALNLGLSNGQKQIKKYIQIDQRVFRSDYKVKITT